MLICWYISEHWWCLICQCCPDSSEFCTENYLFGIDRPNGSLSNKKVVIEPSNAVEDFLSRQMILCLFHVVIQDTRGQRSTERKSDCSDVTLEHKTSLKCQFFKIEIYTSSESWINKLSIDVWFVMIGQYLKIWNLRVQKNLNIEKITFKVVQMKFLAMHITNQKLSFDIFTVGNLQNIFMEHDLNILMIFGIKEKCIILSHTMYCCLLLQI